MCCDVYSKDDMTGRGKESIRLFVLLSVNCEGGEKIAEENAVLFEWFGLFLCNFKTSESLDNRLLVHVCV